MFTSSGRRRKQRGHSWGSCYCSLCSPLAAAELQEPSLGRSHPRRMPLHQKQQQEQEQQQQRAKRQQWHCAKEGQRVEQFRRGHVCCLMHCRWHLEQPWHQDDETEPQEWHQQGVEEEAEASSAREMAPRCRWAGELPNEAGGHKLILRWSQHARAYCIRRPYHLLDGCHCRDDRHDARVDGWTRLPEEG